MRRIGSVTSKLAFVGCLAVHAHALAHDPPAGNGVFERGKGLMVRANRGLIVSANGKDNFTLLCNEALGINTAEVPSIVALESGEWLIGTSHGAMIASRDLCTLTPVPGLDAVAVPALAQDPNTAARVFASTGQSDFDNGLYLSEDAAKSFDVHGVTDKDRLYDRVMVAAYDSMKMYASGLRRKEGVAGFVSFFAVSSDGGATFTEHGLALHDDEYALELLGAHPKQTSTVFGVAHADLGTGVKDRFLRSTDDAANFEETLSVDKLEAFSINEDGSVVLVGARDGLWRSSDAGKSFEQIQTTPVHCLARLDSKFYVCDDREHAAGMSITEDDGTTLERVMTFTQVAAMVSCPANAGVRTACALPWSDWQRELSLGFVLDAGVPDKDAGAADGGSAAVGDDAGGNAGTAAMKPGEDAGCSCAAVGTRRASQRATVWFVLMSLWFLPARRGKNRAERSLLKENAS